MLEKTQAYKTIKWTGNKFTEGADYSYKIYFNKKLWTKSIGNDCKQVIKVMIQQKLEIES